MTIKINFGNLGKTDVQRCRCPEVIVKQQMNHGYPMPCWILAILTAVALVTAPMAPAHADEAGFQQWLEGFKNDAMREGITERVLNEAFLGVTEDPRVIRLDQKQPEGKITLSRYLQNTVTDGRAARGRELMHEYSATLKAIGQRYGVQPKYIVALWGIESSYGEMQGDFSVIRSLATLAYEGRRANFFKGELINALRIVQNEKVPLDSLEGSWAGAMGNCQFMPSTYLAYGADGDGDGKVDIWSSPEDTFASIASYLASLDWDNNAEWGQRIDAASAVTIPNSLTKAESARHWRKMGLNYTRGDGQLYAIYPGAPEEGVYLVTDNYRALLQWNRSRYFATAVGELADAIGE